MTIDIGVLSEKLQLLEDRIQLLEDQRELVELQSRWNTLCSGGFGGQGTHRSDEALEMLAEDVVFEFENQGPRGHAEFLEYFKPFSTMFTQVFHAGTDHITKITGDTATQSAHCAALVQGPGTGNIARITTFRFMNDYVRTVQGWKLKKSRITLALDALFPEPLVAY